MIIILTYLDNVQKHKQINFIKLKPIKLIVLEIKLIRILIFKSSKTIILLNQFIQIESIIPIVILIITKVIIMKDNLLIIIMKKPFLIIMKNKFMNKIIQLIKILVIIKN